MAEPAAAETDAPAPAAVPERVAAFGALAEHWFIACESRALAGKPKAVVMLGEPLVLFRDPAGRPAALEDRCPHRNVPLSFGRVKGERLQCGYHGWQFDGRGECRAVPGLCGAPESRARRVPSYPVRDEGGFVWVWMSQDKAPHREPHLAAHADDPAYVTVRRAITLDCPFFYAIENVLDVPHTAFLHGGLFRGDKPRGEVEAVVRPRPDGIEAQYIGEPRPTGLAGRILSPGGGVVEHFDRFLMPSVAQVEYRIGAESHLLLTSYLTPESETRTRMFAIASLKSPLPGWLMRLALEPVARRILAQDAAVLRKQAANVARFGGEDFVSTELDLLGLQVRRLLAGEPAGGAERRVRLKL